MALEVGTPEHALVVTLVRNNPEMMVALWVGLFESNQQLAAQLAEHEQDDADRVTREQDGEPDDES